MSEKQHINSYTFLPVHIGSSTEYSIMRKAIYRQALAVVVAVTLCYGCASSDSTMDNAGVATESPVTDGNETGAQAPMDPDTDMSSERTADANVSAGNDLGSNLNIVALVQQNPDLSTFFELIRAADLLVTLESPAPYTVFAPTNEAFAALPAGAIEDLKDPANKLELTRILQAHVLPNRITTEEMRGNMPMKTAQGEELVVMRNGTELTVGGASIVTPDVRASNGVVHVIDKVLIPPKSNEN